jgi:hypothetical protein
MDRRENERLLNRLEMKVIQAMNNHQTVFSERAEVARRLVSGSMRIITDEFHHSITFIHEGRKFVHIRFNENGNELIGIDLIAGIDIAELKIIYDTFKHYFVNMGDGIKIDGNLYLQDGTNVRTELDSKLNLTGGTITGWLVVNDVLSVLGRISTPSDIYVRGVILNQDLDNRLLGKSNVGHGHTIADVENLQETLDGKSTLEHLHEIDHVVGLHDVLDSKFDKSGGEISGYLTVSGSITTAGSLTVAGYILRIIG